jgi:hypothetical protein
MRYLNPVRAGLDAVSCLGDGSIVNVKWFQAYPSNPAFDIAYHIYYSTNKESVYSEGVKYASIDGSLEANIIGLTPGQLYFFSVRPVEYNPSVFNLDTQLPIAYDNLRIYPTSVLRLDITATDLVIPLLDTDGFPPTGVIKVGAELIQYTGVNSSSNNLIVPAGGTGAQPVTIVQQDGYDYLPLPGNVGNGSLVGLTAIPNSGAITETWTIKCVFDQPDGYTTPKFIAVGSLSGQKYDGYGNPIYWEANGPTVSNGILSFSITQSSPTFVKGDGFTIKIAAADPGSPSGRGYGGTMATLHTTSGYDGYTTWSPTITLYTIGESNVYDRIFLCQSRFEYPNFPFTTTDGYHQVLKDNLNTDLSFSDAQNVNFPTYDYAGYHRTDPVQLLNGTCVGSYIGGEMGCIDGYGNVNILRGLSLQDQNNQRQEVLLTVTGRPAVLIKRVHTGITCSCYLASSEYQDDRCPFCYGTKFVFGYEQYFNPRNSDGRILVRTSPADDGVKMQEAGLESELNLDIWTLTVPTIHQRDIIVLFDVADNEEFRYEVGTVTRNNTIVGMEGGQKFKGIRIRKTDPAYQIRIFRNTAMFPSKLNTTISSIPGAVLPHSHEIVINEHTTSLNQINQTTAVAQGHNHVVVDGVIQPVLGHTHNIILP